MKRRPSAAVPAIPPAIAAGAYHAGPILLTAGDPLDRIYQYTVSEADIAIAMNEAIRFGTVWTKDGRLLGFQDLACIQLPKNLNARQRPPQALQQADIA